MPRIARRSYLRLELLSPNTFDKLVQFVFGDIIRARIDRMKRKPCCLLIISSTQHLEIYRFFAGDSAYRCHRYALSPAMKSRISFLASAFAGFPASTADFHAKGWREKRWNSGGCDGLKKKHFFAQKSLLPSPDYQPFAYLCSGARVPKAVLLLEHA